MKIFFHLIEFCISLVLRFGLRPQADFCLGRCFAMLRLWYGILDYIFHIDYCTTVFTSINSLLSIVTPFILC
ncbi:hypothetical protein BJV74DRAFT_553426 [Russula compacta]|nr:hypothetical protein BJV74DRAFT_553426 [Russula compacta]